MSNLRELVATRFHNAWIRWMRYLFTKGEMKEDGTFVINAESVKRWKRQMVTPYDQLPQEEQASDIEEADRAIALWDEHGVPELKNTIKSLEEEIRAEHKSLNKARLEWELEFKNGFQLSKTIVRRGIIIGRFIRATKDKKPVTDALLRMAEGETEGEI